MIGTKVCIRGHNPAWTVTIIDELDDGWFVVRWDEEHWIDSSDYLIVKSADRRMEGPETEMAVYKDNLIPV
jgi:hypothetical protein